MLASRAPQRTAGPVKPALSPNKPPSKGAKSSPAPTTYRLITRAADVEMVARAVEESVLVSVDVETSGIDPRNDKIRLLQIAIEREDAQPTVFILDMHADLAGEGFDLLREVFASATMVSHNASFELSFLAPLGLVPGNAVDTMLMSQALYAGKLGQRHGLEDCVQRELGRTIDKALQKSDWSGALSQAQLQYAATDAAVLIDLHKAIAIKVQEANIVDAVRIEHACLPGLTWLRGQGIPFDVAAWTALGQQAEAEVVDLTRQLDAAAPPRPGHLPYQGSMELGQPRAGCRSAGRGRLPVEGHHRRCPGRGGPSYCRSAKATPRSQQASHDLRAGLAEAC